MARELAAYERQSQVDLYLPPEIVRRKPLNIADCRRSCCPFADVLCLCCLTSNQRPALIKRSVRRSLSWVMPLAMRIVLLLSLLSAIPAAAQDRYQDDGQGQPAPIQQTLPETRQGETARSAAGQTGQRRTREQIAQDAGIEPMARINSRVQNRVQSRIRNRIDRYYDPQANAVSPFEVASDQARTAGRPRR